MTVSEALDMQITHRIKSLEQNISRLEGRGAPEKSLSRIYKKLGRCEAKLVNKSEYEMAFPGLMQERALTCEWKFTQFRNGSGGYAIHITTTEAIYAYLPTSCKLFFVGPTKR
jgi:hypothetical protein